MVMRLARVVCKVRPAYIGFMIIAQNLDWKVISLSGCPLVDLGLINLSLAPDTYLTSVGFLYACEMSNGIMSSKMCLQMSLMFFPLFPVWRIGQTTPQ